VDSLKDYSKRVDFLKQVGSFKANNSLDFSNGNKLETSKLQNPGPILSKKDIKPKQIYHKTQLNQEKILRENLFGTNSMKRKIHTLSIVKSFNEKINTCNFKMTLQLRKRAQT
jgi:hypothetical protein